MKPNFYTNQLTDEYVEVVKANPTAEAINEFKSTKFNEIELSQNTLNWDAPLFLPPKKVKHIVSLLFFLSMYGFGGLFKDNWGNVIPAWDATYFSSLICSFFFGFFGWIICAEFLCFHRLDDSAIGVKSYKNEPEALYPIMRVTAWICSITCVVLALFFGPAIFAGAGASALMSFKLIGVKRLVIYEIVPYNSILYFHVIKETNDLCILVKGKAFNDNKEIVSVSETISSVKLCFNNDSMQDVIGFINKKVGYEVEMFVSETHDDSVNLHHKARKLGIPLNRVTIDKKTLEMTADMVDYDSKLYTL